jgi:hypothetical protein
MSGNVRTPAAPPRRPVLLAAILAAVGLGLGVLAWSQIADHRHLAAAGVRAEAQVVSVDEHRQRGVSSFTPTFMFRTADGRVVRERSTESLTSNAEFAGGRRVAVVYDPANPSLVKLASSLDGGVGALTWIIGGFALACFGLTGLALFRRPAG